MSEDVPERAKEIFERARLAIAKREKASALAQKAIAEHRKQHHEVDEAIERSQRLLAQCKTL